MSRTGDRVSTRYDAQEVYTAGAAQPFYDVVTAHIQADYFVRPSAPPLEEEDDDYDAMGDNLGWGQQQRVEEVST